MPPGAKKRKAAKKKKEQEQQANNNNGNHSQGYDESKGQDERESDNCEVNSPVSEGHVNDTFDEGNKGFEMIEVEGNKEPEMIEVDDSQKIDVLDGIEVKIDKELRSVEDKFNEGNKEFETIEVEGKRESEMIEVEESQKIDVQDGIVIKIEKELNSVEDSDKIEKELNSMEDPDNTVVNGKHEPFPEGVVLIAENGKQDKESKDSSIGEASDVIDLGNAVILESPVANLAMESAQVESSEETEREVLPVLKPIEVSRVSEDVLAREKTYDNVIPLLTDNAGVSPQAIVTDMYENGVKTSSPSGTVAVDNIDHPENNAASMASVSSIDGKESQVSMTSSTHSVEASHDAQNGQAHSENSQVLKDEPLIEPIPRVTQRTSWMSCCGLYEVFARSDK